MADASQPQVMLVDPDSATRQQMQMMLEGEGYAVIAADDGSAALQMLGGMVGLPDAIVIERDSPTVATPGFMQALRSYRRFLDLPVVLVARTPGGDPRTFTCIAYVPLPAPRAALLSTLRAITFAKGTAPP